jgi:nucleoside-diphosphate-sugar epimerase
MQDQKVLVTGAAGNIGFGICRHLAADNEVWGVQRFSEPGRRAAVEALGVTTRVIDLATGDYGDLPDDFTYVVHLAAFTGQGVDYDLAIRENAEAAGLLMTHCGKARAFLYASTSAVYDLNPDPWHVFTETDRLGDTREAYSPTYGVTKIVAEGVARTMARALGLPTLVARINTAYDAHGGMPAMEVDWMRAGAAIPIAEPGPTVLSVIHHQDMAEQTEALLDAATVPATTVNWCGDEAVVHEDYLRYLAELLGIEPNYVPITPGLASRICDPSRRASITGPCRFDWRTGMRKLVEERPLTEGGQTAEFLANLKTGAD